MSLLNNLNEMMGYTRPFDRVKCHLVKCLTLQKAADFPDDTSRQIVLVNVWMCQS